MLLFNKYARNRFMQFSVSHHEFSAINEFQEHFCFLLPHPNFQKRLYHSREASGKKSTLLAFFRIIFAIFRFYFFSHLLLLFFFLCRLSIHVLTIIIFSLYFLLVVFAFSVVIWPNAFQVLQDQQSLSSPHKGDIDDDNTSKKKRNMKQNQKQTNLFRLS